MIVRPGQHVDPQGQVYHPYLVGWADFWDVRWHIPGDDKSNHTWKWLLTKVLSRNLIYSTSWPYCETSSRKSPPLSHEDRRNDLLPLSHRLHQHHLLSPLCHKSSQRGLQASCIHLLSRMGDHDRHLHPQNLPSSLISHTMLRRFPIHPQQYHGPQANMAYLRCDPHHQHRIIECPDTIAPHPCLQTCSSSSSSRGRRKDILKLGLLVPNQRIKWLQFKTNSMQARLLLCLPPIPVEYPASLPKTNSSMRARLKHMRHRCLLKSCPPRFNRNHLHRPI